MLKRMRKCHVLHCTEPAPQMHNFPVRDAERLRKWLSATGNPAIQHVAHHKLQRSYQICRKHFAPKYLLQNTKLACTAIPTLHLPEPIEVEPGNLEAASTSTASQPSSIIPNDKFGGFYKKKLIEVPLPGTTVVDKPILDLSLPIIKVAPPSTPPESDPLQPDPSEPPEDMSGDTDIVVRAATRDDMHGVCRLIKALAEFEKMEDQVKMTPEKLIEEGFDAASPSFSCFVAEISGGPLIGYAIYYTCFSTWRGRSIFLEDLYVEPRFRRCGVGGELMLAVAKVAYDTSKRLDFHVLKWNPAVTFYKKLGAVDLSSTEQWGLFRLDEISLNKLFDN